jgi:List-Bact-rpt repeat protein
VRRNPYLRQVAAVATTVALTLTSGAGARSVGADATSLRVSSNGTVTLSPGHRTCAGTCSFHLRQGAIVTLRAKPRRHFVLTHWTGGCIGNAPTCVLALDRSTSVRAEFVGEAEEIALTVSGPGSVVSRPAGLDCGADQGDCTATFPWGTELRLTGKPATGGRFAHWGGECGDVARDACAFVVRDGSEVTASFRHASPASEPQKLIVVSARPGSSFRVVSSPPGIDCTTTCGASFEAGTVVTLRGSPYSAAWSGDCQGDGSDTCSVVVDAPTRVVVFPHFPQAPPPGYGITVTVAGKGTVTAPGIKCGSASGTLLDCENIFGRSATVILTARPAKGARFAGWNQFCVGKKPRCTLHVLAPVTVGAVFRR